MTADLVAFLRARYDEDQRAAEEAPDGPWSVAQAGPGEAWTILGAFTSLARFNTASDTREITVRREEIAGADLGAGGVRTREAAKHIVRHDPARVLADIESKRGVLQLVTKAQEDAAFPDFLVSRPAKVMLLALEPVLQHLALAHADHPDYRKEWRP